MLLTTGSFKAYSLLKDALPARVTVQLVPMDTPVSIALFMRKWQPQVGIVMVNMGYHLTDTTLIYGGRPWGVAVPLMTFRSCCVIDDLA